MSDPSPDLHCAPGTAPPSSPPTMSSSKASPSASGSRSVPPVNQTMAGMQIVNPAPKDLLSIIDSLKKQVAADRCLFIERRIEENRLKLVDVSTHLFKLSLERRNDKVIGIDKRIDLLAKRQKDAIDMQNGIDLSNGDMDSSSSQEEGHASSAILLGSSIAVKNAVRPIKLTEVKRLPPYTTWIFLDRNQRMTEDQSVVGRRRIYYDQNGGEALICSDSEEELIEEEEKKEFVDSEDYILRMTINEIGLSDAALDALAQCFSRKPCEIKERYEVLIKGEISVEDSWNSFLDKDLDAALDSFDNLFCRRCLVFDCRLHGCSQDLVFQAENQLTGSCTDEENVPCGPHCYKLVLNSGWNATITSPVRANSQEKPVPSFDGTGAQISGMKSLGPSVRRREKSCQSESASSNAKNMSESSDSEARPKRQKKMVASDSDTLGSRDIKLRSSSRKENEDASASQKLKSSSAGKPWRKESTTVDAMRKEELVGENISKQVTSDRKSWKTLEKALYEKGVEIFGRKSCLIARNLMNGMKTCSEIFQYMNCSENGLFSRTGDGADSLLDGFSKVDCNETTSNKVRRRSRFLRRRGKVRRLKYTWKSAGYHSIRKRISERKDLPCRQYNPCGCQSSCGKECPCLVNETCCEKYCGCPKTCKNRFRGCHCAKSQCRSRQCPCFAAGRECDPDVCRNCWVSCGDGTLGVPFQRGDNYECRNMKLLLKQQQRVLLGKSDVSGWGAFLKNSVGKHEYLGEYTGELISHREADKRGKIYDRENSSFLFNLNDQFVLDAFRKGDKLKFANHSPNPNCYAKVMMVAGDHRVGIFAKERISAGEELFYDYRYEADRAPAWARKPESSGTKKEDTAPSSGRAKKLA